MASLDSIINITVVDETGAVAQTGFGVPIFIATHSVWQDRIRFYTDLTSVADDGFTTSSKAYLAAQSYFSQTPCPPKIAIGRKDAADTNWADTINAIAEVDNSWYAVATDDHTADSIVEVSDTVNAMTKIYGYSTDDADAKDPTKDTDAFSLLSKKAAKRSFGLWSAGADATFPECGWMGGQLPQQPGSITWAYKQINGSSVDTISSSAETALDQKNANYYTQIAGKNLTINGMVANGEFIDIIRGIDWLKARLQEEQFSLLANTPKIPFEDAGIAMIENACVAVLKEAQRLDVIADYTIEVPKVADTLTNDRANRKLTGIKITARMSGAIHEVDETLYVQV